MSTKYWVVLWNKNETFDFDAIGSDQSGFVVRLYFLTFYLTNLFVAGKKVLPLSLSLFLSFQFSLQKLCDVGIRISAESVCVCLLFSASGSSCQIHCAKSSRMDVECDCRFSAEQKCFYVA